MRVETAFELSISPKPDSICEKLSGDEEMINSWAGMLHGFNAEESLRRFEGNEPLYRKMLHLFGERYAGVGMHLRRLAAEENRDAVQKLAHSLKSMASLLGASQLAQSSVMLEKAARDADAGEFEYLAEQTARAIDEAVQSVFAALPDKNTHLD